MAKFPFIVEAGRETRNDRGDVIRFDLVKKRKARTLDAAKEIAGDLLVFDDIHVAHIDQMLPDPTWGERRATVTTLTKSDKEPS